MATTYTPNYHLGKQEDHNDKFDMNVLTQNADIIDTALHDLDTGKQDAEDGMGLSQESYTTAEKSALALINAAFPYMLTRGTTVMNADSGFGFNDIRETSYIRYTASAVDNPVANAYGIVFSFFFSTYGVQIDFANTSALGCQMLYRFSADGGNTWRTWYLAAATPQS